MAPSFHKHVVLLFLFQERIAVVGGGDKCLLDAACADPTVEVEGTTRLVVGSPDFVIGTPKNFRQRVFQWVYGVS